MPLTAKTNPSGNSHITFVALGQKPEQRAIVPGIEQRPELVESPGLAPFAEFRRHDLSRTFANRLGTKLVLLHIIPGLSTDLPRATGVMQAEELAHQRTLRRLRELTESCELRVTPECMVVFGSPSEKILEVTESSTADAIFMGLRRSARAGTASHTLWTTAYEVARRASCPVMTVRS